MLNRSTRTDFEVRPYRLGDEAGVLSLLRLCLGDGPAGRRPPEFFRWKHFANPSGPSFMFVAEGDRRIVGFRAFVRWRLRGAGTLIPSAFAVDTATHPEYRRKGVFRHLNEEALSAMQGEVDLIFNTPNEKSLPGNLRMGWGLVGKLPVKVRVRKPLRFATHAASLHRPGRSLAKQPVVEASPARDHVVDDGPLVSLLEQAERFHPRLSTPRDLSYLRWRYGDAPLLDYRAVVVGDKRLDGLAIFRVRPRGRLWESTVTEIIVRAGDVRAARRLLALVARSAEVDLLTCHFPDRTSAARAARWSGFLPTPAGITFIANPRRQGIDPDPIRLSSWALSLGDLEVF
jgi:hypothetical protein